MSEYIEQFKRAQDLHRQKFYESAISRCGRIVEEGLSEMYSKLETYMKESGALSEWIEMHSEFSSQQGEKFQVKKAGLGGMILFTRKTPFWNHLRTMCESNLAYIRIIDWERMRRLRNRSSHKSSLFEETEVMEMLFYTKVFLYDCGLVEGPTRPIPVLLEANCGNCQMQINQDWNYCPNCASPVNTECATCSRTIPTSNLICPFCDSQRFNFDTVEENENLYRSYAEAVWADWEVTEAERKWLHKKRLELGLTIECAEQVEKSVIPENYHQFMGLLEAVNIDGIIDQNEHRFLLQKAEILSVPGEIAEKLIKDSAKENKKLKKRILGFGI